VIDKLIQSSLKNRGFVILVRVGRFEHILIGADLGAILGKESSGAAAIARDDA
jgi:hypothetical protein